MIKHWSTDNGKSIYSGPEKDFLRHKESDPNCIEISEHRPTPYHNWSKDGWVEDEDLKKFHTKSIADDELKYLEKFEKAKPMLDAKTRKDLEDFSAKVAMVSIGKSKDMPKRPETLEIQ